MQLYSIRDSRSDILLTLLAVHYANVSAQSVSQETVMNKSVVY